MDMKQLLGAVILGLMFTGFFKIMADAIGWRSTLLGLIVAIAATAAIALGVALVTRAI